MQVKDTEKTVLFQLKGGLFPLTSLQLFTTLLSELGEQLDQKRLEAPKFFQHAPLVIDLQKVNQGTIPPLDFKQLKALLQSRNLIPVGIKNGNPEQQNQAIQAGLAVLQDSIKEPIEELKENKLKPDQEQGKSKLETQGYHTKVITEPVRSGQQIYAQNGDLIVLAAVSHGAELLADGNIHVYAPLRGRALAGVNGNSNTHIFCQSLEAELISVAGQYKISEDIGENFWDKSVDIFLLDGRLQIRTL